METLHDCLKWGIRRGLKALMNKSHLKNEDEGWKTPKTKDMISWHHHYHLPDEVDEAMEYEDDWECTRERWRERWKWSSGWMSSTEMPWSGLRGFLARMPLVVGRISGLAESMSFSNSVCRGQKLMIRQTDKINITVVWVSLDVCGYMWVCVGVGVGVGVGVDVCGCV